MATFRPHWSTSRPQPYYRTFTIQLEFCSQRRVKLDGVCERNRGSIHRGSLRNIGKPMDTDPEYNDVRSAEQAFLPGSRANASIHVLIARAIPKPASCLHPKRAFRLANTLSSLCRPTKAASACLAQLMSRISSMLRLLQSQDAALWHAHLPLNCANL